MQRMGLGGMELHVLAVLFGLWGRTAKGGRNKTRSWPERNGMKEALLRGLPRLGLTMNGMERKVAERSVALECNVEKRKPPAAGIGRQTTHELHFRRMVMVLRFLMQMKRTQNSHHSNFH